MALINVQNASLGYDGKTIVESVDFSLNPGDYLCIVGENGSGKSTLMKTILGLLKPIEGKISFDNGLKQTEIGYLPQQTDVQKDFPASVEEIVLSGCLNRCGLRPYYNRDEKQLAKKNMERLEIYDLCKRCYRELSGGQQQRTLLARALCATQKMLLLDEPAAGLDPKATESMYEIINNLHNQDKIAIIMISHDMKATIKYATHILHIGEHPLFFGETAKYLETDIGKMYLAIKGGEVL